jgi:HD-GYP domain-containing protein (c-di-GMP phosphodiesterase class II)
VEAVRLADLLGGMSRLADLGFGLPVGVGLRSCALATRLAQQGELSATDVRAAFYTAMLHHVGCVGYARETALLFGDDLAANTAGGRTDAASMRDVFTTFMPLLTRDRPPLERVRLTYRAVTKGPRWGEQFTATACDVGREAASRLGLPEEVQSSLFHVYDMWAGTRGQQVDGDAIPVGARIARLSGIAVLFESIGGTALAEQAVRRRAGGMLDPDLVDEFLSHGSDWLDDLDQAAVPRVVLDSEPLPHVTTMDVRAVTQVFGDLADLKSPCFIGHSRAVAALAREAADRLGLPEGTRRDVELAGHLLDVGRVGISNLVWDKPGPLSTGDWEQVRLHPYHSERILAGSAELGRLVPLVGRHHERLDGSGYHRGSTADDLPMPARVLAVADVFRSLTERRPHRPPLDPEQATARLLDDVRRQALDAEATQAVLTVAGQQTPPLSRSNPKGLSAREVEVLCLVARGFSNRDIAGQLSISRRTAEHHVQHIYTKIGMSGRAAATLFAVEHRLLDKG